MIANGHNLGEVSTKTANSMDSGDQTERSLTNLRALAADVLRAKTGGRNEAAQLGARYHPSHQVYRSKVPVVNKQMQENHLLK